MKELFEDDFSFEEEFDENDELNSLYIDLVEQGVAAYWKKLEEVGWLNELRENRQQRIKKQLARIQNDVTKAIFCLAQTEIDGEAEELSYNDILLQLADDSDEAYTFENYKEVHSFKKEDGTTVASYTLGGKLPKLTKKDYDTEEVTISCELNGKLVEHTFIQADDVFQSDEVIEVFLNNALIQAGVNKNWYLLPTLPDETSVSLVFISPKVYESAKEEGIVPCTDFFYQEWSEEEEGNEELGYDADETSEGYGYDK
jgi:hypothetical protein